MHKMQTIRKKIQSQEKGKYWLDQGMVNNNMEAVFWKSKPKIFQKKPQHNISIFPLLYQIEPHHFLNHQTNKPNVQSNAKIRKYLRNHEGKSEPILSREEQKLKIYEREGLSSSDLITRSLRINCPKEKKKCHSGFATNDRQRCGLKNECAQILIAIKSHKKMKSSVEVIEESMIEPITLPFLIDKRCKTVQQQPVNPEYKYSITPWDNEQDM